MTRAPCLASAACGAVREFPRRAAENGASALFVHAPSSAFFDPLMYVAIQDGSVLAPTPPCATVLLSLWRRALAAEATFWLMAIVGAAALDFVAAQGFTWLRPALWIPRMQDTARSFPSLHAMASPAMVAAVCALVWATAGVGLRW
jgi:hypothetical protein